MQAFTDTWNSLPEKDIDELLQRLEEGKTAGGNPRRELRMAREKVREKVDARFLELYKELLYTSFFSFHYKGGSTPLNRGRVHRHHRLSLLRWPSPPVRRQPRCWRPSGREPVTPCPALIGQPCCPRGCVHPTAGARPQAPGAGARRAPPAGGAYSPRPSLALSQASGGARAAPAGRVPDRAGWDSIAPVGSSRSANQREVEASLLSVPDEAACFKCQPTSPRSNGVLPGK
jgi:hypothetical protein